MVDSTQTTECIACSELILAEAKLCKHCKTRQDDSSRSNRDKNAAISSLPKKAAVPANLCAHCGTVGPVSAFGWCSSCLTVEPAITQSPASTSAPGSTHGNGQVREGAGSMAVGGIVCLVGILITAGTYNAASDGGHFVVAWGAIVFGAIQFFRGLIAWSNSD